MKRVHSGMTDEDLAAQGYYRDERGSVLPRRFRTPPPPKPVAPVTILGPDHYRRRAILQFVDWLYDETDEAPPMPRETLLGLWRQRESRPTTPDESA